VTVAGCPAGAIDSGVGQAIGDNIKGGCSDRRGASGSHGRGHGLRTQPTGPMDAASALILGAFAVKIVVGDPSAVS
jgi:hypothetical protein